MVENILISRFLMDVMPIAASASTEEDTIKRFTEVVRSLFGIDRANVNLLQANQRPESGVTEYLINTRKAYVDNQLSEYSAFPELISYKNQGFMSGAFLPIMAHGKVIATLELLSNSENKFSDDLVGSVAFGAAFIGFSLAYKVEAGRNVRLAGYFDSAFGSDIPQFLVSANGTIAKSNKAAMRKFAALAGQEANINGIIGMDFAALSQLVNGKYKIARIGPAGEEMLARISASRISDTLIHVVAEDVTHAAYFDAVAGALKPQGEVMLALLKDDLTISRVYGGVGSQFSAAVAALPGRKLTDIFDRKAHDLKPAGEAKPGSSVSGTADMMLPDGLTVRVRYALNYSPAGPMLVVSSADLEKYVSGLKSDLGDFINATSDVVMTVDESGYITDCNLSVEHVLGYPKEELVGRSIRDLYRDTAILDRDIAYVRSGGSIDNTYVNVAKKDGEPIPATHSVRLLRSAEKSSYLFLIRELATKNMVEDLQASLRQAAATEKNLRTTGTLKSQFIYNISHELKTPLTNIKGFAKLMYDGDFGTLNEEQKEYVKTILDESDRLMLIITQVLDAAKLEAQKVKLEIKEVNLRDLSENPTIKSMEESARNKGLEFSWDVAYDVPNIMADPNRLIQVLVNLIGNSIKFTEKGSISVRVTKKGRKYVEFTVADTGIGISDEDKKKVFKKFYQAPKKSLVKPDGTGTGLGLSITHDIVSLHGGKIGFESQLGNGSSFWFTMPIVYKEKKEKQ